MAYMHWAGVFRVATVGISGSFGREPARTLIVPSLTVRLVSSARTEACSFVCSMDLVAEVEQFSSMKSARGRPIGSPTSSWNGYLVSYPWALTHATRWGRRTVSSGGRWRAVRMALKRLEQVSAVSEGRRVLLWGGGAPVVGAGPCCRPGCGCGWGAGPGAGSASLHSREQYGCCSHLGLWQPNRAHVGGGAACPAHVLEQ